jgi:hypothetical protein
MITSRQRLSCRPQRLRCRVSAARLQRSESVCARTATRGGSSKWTVHHVVATPGQAAGWLPGPSLPAARASLTTSINESPRSGLDELNPTAPSASMSDGPSHRGGSRLTRESPHLVLEGSSDGAPESRSLPGVGRVTDGNPGRDHPRLPHPATRPSPRHTPHTVLANRRRTPTASAGRLRPAPRPHSPRRPRPRNRPRRHTTTTPLTRAHTC